MPELLDVARRIAAQAAPGEQLEAYVSRGTETSVRSFDQSVESLSSAGTSGVGVRVVTGGKVGFAWVAALDESAAHEALAGARDNAPYATPDEFAGLAEPDGVEPVALDLWRDELAELPTEQKIDFAIDLERRVLSGDARMRRVISADYSDALVETAVASSIGIEAWSRRTMCSLFCFAMAGEGDDTQTGLGYSVGRAPSDLDTGQAAADAVERATRMLGAHKPASARMTVVFDRRVTATLLSVLAGTLSGEEVAKGRSLFANRIGEEVAAPAVILLDDPTDAAAPRAGSYDAEGLATRRNVLIENGVLAAFLQDTHSARILGTSSTGSAVRGGFKTVPGVGARAVVLRPGALSQDEVVATVGEGLFVQSVSGVHSGVNPISGDFSVGAEGLMIRDGALAEPVRELTIASSLQRMLQHVVAIGSDLEWTPGAAGLTLAIDGISMSGA